MNGGTGITVVARRLPSYTIGTIDVLYRRENTIKSYSLCLILQYPFLDVWRLSHLHVALTFDHLIGSRRTRPNTALNSSNLLMASFTSRRQYWASQSSFSQCNTAQQRLFQPLMQASDILSKKYQSEEQTILKIRQERTGEMTGSPVQQYTFCW